MFQPVGREGVVAIGVEILAIGQFHGRRQGGEALWRQTCGGIGVAKEVEVVGRGVVKGYVVGHDVDKFDGAAAGSESCGPVFDVERR